MRRTRLAMIFCSALRLASPAIAHDAENAKPARPLPGAALPAPLERALRDYERAWRSADARALAALFAEDGFVLQSNQPPVRGRTAIEAAYAGQGGSPLRLRALAHSVEGNRGYIIGAYRYGSNEGTPASSC